MKLIFCALAAINFLCAIALDDIHITPKDEQVEIDLILDSPFDGNVIQRDSDEFSTLIFKDIKYNKNKVTTTTKLIPEIEIFAREGDLYVVLAKENLTLNTDIAVRYANNTLKILLTPKIGIASNLLANSNLTNSNLEIQGEGSGIETWRYILVVAILIALLVALVIVKRRTIKLGSNGTRFTYFNQKTLNVSQVLNIDIKNKVVVLDSQDAKYLLFIGTNSSFVIDKIDLKKESQNDVNKILDSRGQAKLSYLLKMYDNEK